jgi:hypothetical protein
LPPAPRDRQDFLVGRAQLPVDHERGSVAVIDRREKVSAPSWTASSNAVQLGGWFGRQGSVLMMLMLVVAL